MCICCMTQGCLNTPGSRKLNIDIFSMWREIHYLGNLLKLLVMQFLIWTS